MNTSLSPGQPASVEFQAWGYKHASRPNFAVRDLSLTISAGQRVLLLGASGIGKSTLLQGVAGILGSSQLYPTQEGFSQASSDEVEVEDADGGLTQGRILIDGVPVKQALGQVGLVLQDPDAQAIFQRVGDNVAFGPENMNVPPDKIWPLVEQSMSAVGLSDIQLHRSVTHLSGGQMQRLALAGALAMRPGVLLLDEPTANLDPSGVKQIVEAVGQVLDKQGSTMILVEHQAQAWIDLVDRVIVLGNERVTDAAQSKTVIVADGSPEDVFTDQSLDLASLGIWVPERYMKSSSGAQRFLDSSNRDSEDKSVSKAVLLSTHDLAIGRDHTPIASGINLDFCAGQITALVGANGAGKTTLSLTLAGLLEAVDGTIEASSLLLGEAAKDRGCSNPYEWDSKTLASRISYVFQNPEHQFARGTVLEEVMLAPLRTGMSVEEAQNRAKSLLERFHLLQYSQENPYTLSGGEKRRLTVASALAAAPKVLILDEPTFGQDRVTWTNMVELIADLRNDGICVIVVTHDRQLVKALDARLVELTPQDVESTWLRKSDGTVKAGPQSLELASEVKQHCEQLPGHSSEIHIPVKAMEQRLEERRLSSKSPYIASINPSYRLIGGFLIALPLFFSLDWLSALTALVTEIVLLMLAGFSPWRIVRSTWPLFVGLPGSALAVLLYGKAGGEVLWQWGFINVTERSTMLAAATALRILAIGIPAIILMLGIDATDLADSFSQVLHLPDRFVYGGLAGMRLFSVLQDDWSSLTASRRSRGLGDENKFKAFLPQAFALLVLSIRRSSMLAEAMEARGFGGTGPRSHARKSQVQSRDFVFLSLCLTIPICSLLVAWRTGTFAFFGN